MAGPAAGSVRKVECTRDGFTLYVLVQPKCRGLSRLSTAVASSDCLSSTDDSDKALSILFSNTRRNSQSQKAMAQVPREHICIVEPCMHTHTYTCTRRPNTWRVYRPRGDSISPHTPHANAPSSVVTCTIHSLSHPLAALSHCIRIAPTQPCRQPI